jgi:NADPH:quinone reductase-like Zn-dependent oxidoreductase
MMTVVAHSELVGKVVKVKKALAGSNVGNRVTDLII